MTHFRVHSDLNVKELGNIKFSLVRIVVSAFALILKPIFWFFYDSEHE
jgi:hypothetical protein